MSPWLRRAFFALIAAFLLMPPMVVLGVSLNGGRLLLFPPADPSFKWYGAMVSDEAWTRPILNSVTIAASAAALAVLIALPIALAAWRRPTPLIRLIQTIGFAPFILPPVVLALGYLAFWTTMGWSGGIENDIISHAFFLVTLPLVTLSLGLAAIDPALIEAARTMGATPGAVLRTVVLPLLLPYMLSGYAFVFVLSLNEYIIAYMVAGFTVETLPIKIFNSLRYGYTPIMACATVLFFVVSALIFSAIARFGDLPRLLGAWNERR